MPNEIRIKKFVKNEIYEQDDLIIKENRLDVFVNKEFYSSLMCLRQDLTELSVGFLFSEGIINSYEDIKSLGFEGDERVFAVIENPYASKEKKHKEGVNKVTGSVKISPDEVVKMAESFNKQSELFLKTGAAHSCALVFQNGGNLFFEDIGRHNAVDKVIGKALIDGLNLDNGILLTSGRIFYEMITKAARLGIPVLVSLAAPTDMAVEAAREMNITLIGFAKNGRFNIYSGDDRII